MSRVGENIKKLRMDAGMSQKELAKKLGVAENFLYDVELGRKVVNESLINKVTKVLGKQLNDIGMSVEEGAAEEIQEKVLPARKEVKPQKPDAIQDVWSNAFGSVLKNVPVYRYDMRQSLYTRLLPLQSNKVEGYPADKVFFLEIQDDDMIGFRIAKGDLAFAHLVSEAENNSICLIDYNGERVLRQIKKLDNGKALLVSNRGSLRTETVNLKDIRAVAKLERVEIKL